MITTSKPFTNKKLIDDGETNSSKKLIDDGETNSSKKLIDEWETISYKKTVPKIVPKIELKDILVEKKDKKIVNKIESVFSSDITNKKNRIPTGIVAVLDKASKEKIREFLPNNGNSLTDSKIIDMIIKMKNDSSLKLFDFKKRVVMILHQALKKDRYPLVSKIFDMWKKFKFPMIELIDSTCDNCKPITQAVWNGSIECIRLIISLEPELASMILNTINTKGESLEQTLNLGKSYSLKQNSSAAVFIEERFNTCSKFLTSAILTNNRHINESVNYKDFLEPNISIEINEIMEMMKIDDSESEIMYKIALQYADNFELAHKYFLATKKCVAKEFFEEIEEKLKDEGITF